MQKGPFQKLLQQRQCVTKDPNFPVKICFTKFSQVCLQTKAQRSIWSQEARSQYPSLILLTIVHILCNYLCSRECALPDVLFINLTSGAGKTSLTPENSTNFTKGNFLFWLPSYFKSHVIWRKPSKIIHNPGTEITTQSIQNFTPVIARLVVCNCNWNFIWSP